MTKDENTTDRDVSPLICSFDAATSHACAAHVLLIGLLAGFTFRRTGSTTQGKLVFCDGHAVQRWLQKALSCVVGVASGR